MLSTNYLHDGVVIFENEFDCIERKNKFIYTAIIAHALLSAEVPLTSYLVLTVVTE